MDDLHNAGNSRGKIFGMPHNVRSVIESSLHNLNNPKILPLYRIIGAFKTRLSKLIHKHQNNFYFQWQKSFYDRIIRSETELKLYNRQSCQMG